MVSDERLYAVKTAALGDVLRKMRLDQLFRAHPVGPSGPGVGGFLKNIGRHGVELTREGLFGSPLTAIDELKKHFAATGSVSRAYGRYLKDFYLAPKSPGWVRGLSVGLPALETGMALANDDGSHRGEILASGAAGVASAPVFARTGLLGLPLQMAVQEGAGHAGALLDRR